MPKRKLTNTDAPHQPPARRPQVSTRSNAHEDKAKPLDHVGTNTHLIDFSAGDGAATTLGTAAHTGTLQSQSVLPTQTAGPLIRQAPDSVITGPFTAAEFLKLDQSQQ